MLAITHDIKAPLGSVMGYIDLLSRLTTGKREGLYLHNMKESSEHLLALVNSLLDFYRLDINSHVDTWRSARHNCSRRSARGLRPWPRQRASPWCSKPGRGPGTR